MPKQKDETVGQTKRATDSRPRPGSKTPEIKPAVQSDKATEPQADGDRKPSASSSPLDPGRPVKES